MTEYFVVANSNVAPFVSDKSEDYVKGNSPEEALKVFIRTYRHPAGLYAANLYRNADEYHKSGIPLATYRSERAKKQKSSNHEQQ